MKDSSDSVGSACKSCRNSRTGKLGFSPMHRQDRRHRSDGGGHAGGRQRCKVREMYRNHKKEKNIVVGTVYEGVGDKSTAGPRGQNGSYVGGPQAQAHKRIEPSPGSINSDRTKKGKPDHIPRMFILHHRNLTWVNRDHKSSSLQQGRIQSGGSPEKIID